MSDGDFDPEDMIDPFERELELRAAAARSRALQQSRTRCMECDETIPEARRKALPGVKLCVECQTMLDGEASRYAGADLSHRSFE